MTDTTLERVETLQFQGAVNRMIRGLLRLPLLGRLAGRRLVTLYVVGRKSGRRYAVPVAYAKDGDHLLVGTPFGWARNLRTGDSVELQLRGRRRRADVEVITDQAGVVEHYARMCRANRQFAQFNKIRLDGAGEPDRGDLRAAWSAGARVLRLRPS